jgi:hypothetical protein
VKETGHVKLYYIRRYSAVSVKSLERASGLYWTAGRPSQNTFTVFIIIIIVVVVVVVVVIIVIIVIIIMQLFVQELLVF